MQIYKDALNAIAANDVQAVNEASTPSYATIKELKGLAMSLRWIAVQTMARAL